MGELIYLYLLRFSLALGGTRTSSYGPYLIHSCIELALMRKVTWAVCVNVLHPKLRVEFSLGCESSLIGRNQETSLV